MELEKYFNFFASDDIRIKGHRIGIETILSEYLFKARTPEEIAETYRITLDKVYATILYYLINQESVTKYMEDWIEWGHQQREKQRLNPHPSAERLRKIKAEREGKLQNYDTSISNG